MFYTILFVILTYFILTQSAVSLHYAFHGFSLWYSKMIPSLLPFMILSGIMIRMNLTEHFAKILHPLLKKLFRCSANMSYGILMGFLCGFPMGAKTTSDLLKKNKITLEQASFLLAFCNNIGPVYFCTFIVPLLQLENPFPYLAGMYGLPLIYGFILRRTVFKELSVEIHMQNGPAQPPLSLLVAIDEAIKAAIQSILMLCGYMILFNLLNILPHFLLPNMHGYIAPVLEITGGLSKLGTSLPYYSLCLLPFGGLSCIAQTNSMISGTGLSIRKYTIHKLILTAMTILYYIVLHIFLNEF